MAVWRIGELLIQKRLISWEQLDEVLNEQEQTKESTGELLVKKGYVSRNVLFRTLAEQGKLRFVELARTRINPEDDTRVPGDFARRYKIVPVEFREGALTVAVPHPFHLWPQEEIQNKHDVDSVRKVLCMPEEIEKTLDELYK